MNKLYLTCLFLVALKGTDAIDYSCTPSVDCQTYGVSALVPDPVDCEKYYVCINFGGNPVPSTISTPCPEGQYFNGVLGACSPETSPGICNSACGDNVCNLSCPDPFLETTFIPSSFDCSVYYVCTQSGAIPITCPTEIPYFNGIGCVSDATQCCSCRPHCLNTGTEIQDPCDCNSYYICSAVGQPHSNNRGTCPAGTYFDATQVSCIAGFCTDSCLTCAV